MLHPYREAAKTQISLPAFPLQEAPGRTFFSMLCDINHWLAESPCVYGSAHGTSLYILYKNVAYLIDDFWEAFSLPMAAVGHTWPVCVFGTAQNQETVQLSAEAVEKQIQLIQRSNFSTFSGRCRLAVQYCPNGLERQWFSPKSGINCSQRQRSFLLCRPGTFPQL